MGSRLFSNTTGLLGGHDFLNAEHRAKVAQTLDIDEALIPTENSLAYDQIMEAISADKIKGLWIIATNAAHSWINQSGFKEIIKKLDFLVVQDMYGNTETVAHADLVLPAAGWAEKEGTFINSERRFGLVKKVQRAPGQALSDFNIFKLIAQYWGCADLLEKWQTPEDVFQSMKALSLGQPCDFSGIRDYQHLEQASGIQWPCPAGTQVTAANNQRRLFADGQFFHPDGRAKFIFESPKKLPEPLSKAYPFMLLTGRGTSAQWHTQTRTSKSAVLRKLYPQEVYAEINPTDATMLNITPNEYVWVQSQRGKIRVKAYVTGAVRPGQIFIPMHYHMVNQLTYPAYDSYSRQPSYKSCAVDLKRIAHWEN